MKAEQLPPHLRKYVVEQNYSRYTPVDQAVWRYVLRQLREFLSKNAHECYLEGLDKTGISVERIPRIEEISDKLEKFGWRAMPVSGFIPPAAFMELQSLSILPIASDMRSLDHLLYTPAPDIVHEAAGHAPILIHPEFSEYLKSYAMIAKKAIISQEDLDLYEAIRELSDIKESPTSTSEEIKAAEENLVRVSSSIQHVSEATELSRMNWWTAEYGLIGDLRNPKIYGAGLLSSIGESSQCLNDQVKKIPLTVDCIKTTYDITEQQPQLFVTPDFATLSKVLQEMAEGMAFKCGGLEGVKKAVLAKSVNSLELNSGLQISGKVVEPITQNSQIVYFKTEGPTQLSYQDKELRGHDKNYHAHGYSSPLGPLKGHTKELSDMTETEWQQQGWTVGKTVRFEFASGIIVEGTLDSKLERDGKVLLVTLSKAFAKLGEQVLFAPEWGLYDMALGTSISSVFGGPADRLAYGEFTDFVAKRVPTPKYSQAELKRHARFQALRELRETKVSLQQNKTFKNLVQEHAQEYPADWLFFLEVVEIAHNQDDHANKKWGLELLHTLAQAQPAQNELISDGLKLLGTP